MFFFVNEGMLAEVAIAFLVVLLVSVWQTRSKRKLSHAMKRVQGQHRDLSQRYARVEEDLARKKEIAERIPVIVRRLSESLPPSAIPPIGVRFAGDFFHASQVGYFTPLKDTDEFVLVGGAGYPPDMMNRVRVSADEGILGTALRTRMVVSREDPLVSAGMRSGKTTLESVGMAVDFVAPVYAHSKIAGALVLAGCRVDIRSERPYISMLADLLSGARRTTPFPCPCSTSTISRR